MNRFKDRQITTALVYDMIRNSKSHEKPSKSANTNSFITVQYQKSAVKPGFYNPFSQTLKDHTSNHKDNNCIKVFSRSHNKSLESDNNAKEPKIIDVEFEPFKRPKNVKKSQKNEGEINLCRSLIIDSMQRYISKVEKGKKKRKQKFEKIRYFGVDIQSIKSSIDSTQNKLVEHSQKVHAGEECGQMTQAKVREKLSVGQLGDNRVELGLKSVQPTKKSRMNNRYHKANKQQQRTIHAKFKRMMNFFSVFLSSYGAYMVRERPKDLAERDTTDIQPAKFYKKKEKYYYYIGKGNNKNAIVSLFKKRWWWDQVDDLNSADFVWTQLKLPAMLSKQSSMAYSDLQEPRPELYRRQRVDTEQAQPSLSKIFHPAHSPKFYTRLSASQRRETLREMSLPSVLHNHYEANYMLGNKKALFYNISYYKTYKNQNPFEYLPLTFHVENTNSSSFKKFELAAKQSKQRRLWIVKPGENSNRGQGIFISDVFSRIKSRISKDPTHTYIIQQYLINTLMFQRRKFDIRAYLLMVSIAGVKKFYWYSEGYLRTCSEIYDLSDLDNPLVHLTNDAIQIDGQNYGKYEKGNKVTYHEFQRYLEIKYPDHKYSVQSLVASMKAIAKQVVEATYFKLDPSRKQTAFELFGMDFIIDSKFKPWLLEVNTNPCLQLTGPVLERLIPRMLQNMFRITIDPIFQPPRDQIPRCLNYFIPDNILDSNRFQLIFDSLFDRDLQFEQFCRVHNKQQVYEDENQQFDDDGEFIKFDQ